MSTTVEPIKELLGYTIIKVEMLDDYCIKFYRDDGAVVKMEHHQDCCESVRIVDVSGELSQLTGLVVEAEAVTNDEYKEESDQLYYDEDYLWTFYKIGTVNEFVCIRWLGTSNGYYSIDVGIEVVS